MFAAVVQIRIGEVVMSVGALNLLVRRTLLVELKAFFTCSAIPSPFGTTLPSGSYGSDGKKAGSRANSGSGTQVVHPNSLIPIFPYALLFASLRYK